MPVPHGLLDTQNSALRGELVSTAFSPARPITIGAVFPAAEDLLELICVTRVHAPDVESVRR